MALAYLAGAWLLLQIADVLWDIYGLSESVLQILANLLAVGLIPAVILSWVFEWTPAGIRRDTGAAESTLRPAGDVRRLDRAIIVVLVLAVGFFAVDKFVLDPGRDADMAEEIRADVRVEAFGDRSIVVLPFANMSSDPEQDYFTDGISEEILNLLARMKELRVISRSTAFTYRGDVNIRDVAEELNVAYVLEGSVRKAGDSIRITAQLIDGRADAHVWSNTWDRDLADIFAVQDEVARDVAAELEVQLVNRRRPTQETDPETYAMYLQARHLYYGEAWDVGDKAIPKRLLRVVLDRDPDYVPALTLLALILTFENTPSSEAEFSQLVSTAYELDPDDAVATLYKGLLLARAGDSDAGIRFLETALELDPGNTEVLRMGALTAYGLGKFDVAITLGKRAISTNPLCIICYPSLLLPYKASGELEKAVALQRQRIDLVDDYGGWSNLGHVLLAMGRADEALEIFEQIATDMRANDGGFESFEPEYLSATAEALYKLDRAEEAAARIAQLEALDQESSFFVARYYASIGDVPNALDATAGFLEPNFKNRFQYIVWDEEFASLHDTPEWKQWRADAGLDDESLDAIEFRIPDFGD